MSEPLDITQVRNNLDKFGFVKLPGFFKEELPRILQEFSEIMARHLEKYPHDGKLRSVFWQCVDSSEYLTSLLVNQRLHEMVRALVGDDFIYTGSSGNYYAGNTGWHCDDITLHKRIKVAIYLENLMSENGALRFIPGSHKPTPENFELLTMLSSSKKSFGLHGSEIPAVAVDITPGDIVIFDQNILHSSWGGGEVRRMISMNFHQHYDDNLMPFLKNYIDEMARFMRPETFGPAIMHSKDDEILRMTAPIRDLEHIFASSLQKRLGEGAEPARDAFPDFSYNEDASVIVNEYARDGALGESVRKNIAEPKP